MSLFTFDTLLPEMLGEIMARCDPLVRLLLGATSKKHRAWYIQAIPSSVLVGKMNIWHFFFTYGTRDLVRWAWNHWERPGHHSDINCALLAQNYDVVTYLVQRHAYEEEFYGIQNNEAAMQWCYAHRNLWEIVWEYDECGPNPMFASPPAQRWCLSRHLKRRRHSVF